MQVEKKRTRIIERRRNILNIGKSYFPLVSGFCLIITHSGHFTPSTHVIQKKYTKHAVGFLVNKRPKGLLGPVLNWTRY